MTPAHTSDLWRDAIRPLCRGALGLVTDAPANKFHAVRHRSEHSDTYRIPSRRCVGYWFTSSPLERHRLSLARDDGIY